MLDLLLSFFGVSCHRNYSLFAPVYSISVGNFVFALCLFCLSCLGLIAFNSVVITSQLWHTSLHCLRFSIERCSILLYACLTLTRSNIWSCSKESCKYSQKNLLDFTRLWSIVSYESKFSYHSGISLVCLIKCWLNLPITVYKSSLFFVEVHWKLL